jgi:signal transduction histidine kinase
VGPAASEANIAIRVVPTRLQLRLDKVLFERAISNLLNNALVHSGADRITIGARRHGPRVRIWVIDNGCGVSPSDAERVFDDYFRGASSKAALTSGFGLGLSSVRRIATLMGGTAGIDPQLRKGAAFFLEFPALSANRERV